MPTDKPVLIDSHCHPHFSPLGDDIEGVITAMKNHGVGKALIVSTSLAETDSVLALCQRYHPYFYAACGIHPCTDELMDEDRLRGYLKNPQVIAIGETGLDYYHEDSIPIEIQRNRFIQHINIARELSKPLIIHTRDSMADVLELLRQEQAVSGVLHCYTGNLEQMRQALDLGFYISFSGIISFKSAEELRQVACYVPNENYLVETDSPYLAPTPYRGKVNTPAYVYYVAQAVAMAKGITFEEVVTQTTENFNRLFLKTKIQ